MVWQKFDKGERVHFDAGFYNGGVVIVISQTPLRLFSMVHDEDEDCGKSWFVVMANRLTSLKLKKI